MDQLEQAARPALTAGMSSAGRLPDFVIIGAMKCATSTLYEQLVAQPGIHMCSPKEPNFFSDDETFHRGEAWYRGLFRGARPGDIAGEASTHYTKLPTYPHCVRRMRRTFSEVRLIYVMRHPVERLKSHYLHEVSMGVVQGSIENAVIKHPELVDYGLYAMQLEPFLEAFGPPSILPIFFDRLTREPQTQLERLCAFIGYQGKPQWDPDLRPSNVSRDRIRRLPFEDLLIRSSLATAVRRTLVPRAWREQLKRRLRIREETTLPEALQRALEERFDNDLRILGQWLGCDLTCSNFKAETAMRDLRWRF